MLFFCFFRRDKIQQFPIRDRPPPPRSLTAPSAVLHGPTSPHILLVSAGKGSKRTQTESFSPPVFLGDICLDPVRIDNLRLFIVFPIQALTAAVTKALVLPIQGNSTPWTDGVASVMPKHAYLGHGRRLTKGQFQKKLLFLSQPSSPHSWISSRNNSAKRRRLSWGRIATSRTVSNNSKRI